MPLFKIINFVINWKKLFLGSAGSNLVGGYLKDKDLGLYQPYLMTPSDQKLDLLLKIYSNLILNYTFIGGTI